MLFSADVKIWKWETASVSEIASKFKKITATQGKKLRVNCLHLNYVFRNSSVVDFVCKMYTYRTLCGGSRLNLSSLINVSGCQTSDTSSDARRSTLNHISCGGWLLVFCRWRPPGELAPVGWALAVFFRATLTEDEIISGYFDPPLQQEYARARWGSFPSPGWDKQVE